MNTRRPEQASETLDFRGKNIFPTSADPMHFGHLEAWRMARLELGEPVILVIVNNDAKQDQYLFGIEERLAIAQKYKDWLSEFDNYPLGDCDIVVVSDKQDIEKMLQEAKTIVRKDRGSIEGQMSDREETGAIMTRYGLADWHEKVRFIPVSPQYSSFALKQRVAEGAGQLEIALQEVVDAVRGAQEQRKKAVFSPELGH